MAAAIGLGENHDGLALSQSTQRPLCPAMIDQPEIADRDGFSEAGTVNGTTESESANSTSRFERDMRTPPGASRSLCGYYDASHRPGRRARQSATASMLPSDSSSLPAGDPVIEKI